ncbi:MAG TPA: hypothetical protein VEK11_11365 [Thermoanaerobaculia bacterium]|nr:hypothetical protein [Thermoanaerobaculia bacterium]
MRVPVLEERPVVSGRDTARLLAANDPLLAPLILAATDEERRQALEFVLVAHARPIVSRVIARYRSSDRLLRGDEAEDITGSVMLRLVRKLQSAAIDADEAVECLEDFAATLSFNAIYDFMRHRFPERTRLKNRIRYVLTRDERFRMWSAAAGTLCALVHEVDGPPQQVRACRGRLDREQVGDALETLLKAAGGPVSVSDIVAFLADHWNVTDSRARDVSMDVPVEMNPGAELESREYLETLWREIRSMRPQHRAALLLNLRDGDGGNAVALFVLLGITTIEEVAEAIEIPLERLAELWGQLPLDDLKIASMLGLTRQQVINLRRSARERLARRMKAVK